MRSETSKAAQREYSNRKRKDPKHQAKQKVWSAQWRAANPLSAEQKARRADQAKQYAVTRRLQHKARWLTQRAILACRIVRQPCEVCGALKVHAHHDDYSKPLDVRWLCPPCHRSHHDKAKLS